MADEQKEPIETSRAEEQFQSSSKPSHLPAPRGPKELPHTGLNARRSYTIPSTSEESPAPDYRPLNKRVESPSVAKIFEALDPSEDSAPLAQETVEPVVAAEPTEPVLATQPVELVEETPATTQIDEQSPTTLSVKPNIPGRFAGLPVELTDGVNLDEPSFLRQQNITQPVTVREDMTETAQQPENPEVQPVAAATAASVGPAPQNGDDDTPPFESLRDAVSANIPEDEQSLEVKALSIEPKGLNRFAVLNYQGSIVDVKAYLVTNGHNLESLKFVQNETSVAVTLSPDYSNQSQHSEAFTELLVFTGAQLDHAKVPPSFQTIVASYVDSLAKDSKPVLGVIQPPLPAAAPTVGSPFRLTEGPSSDSDLVAAVVMPKFHSLTTTNSEAYGKSFMVNFSSTTDLVKGFLIGNALDTEKFSILPRRNSQGEDVITVVPAVIIPIDKPLPEAYEKLVQLANDNLPDELVADEFKRTPAKAVITPPLPAESTLTPPALPTPAAQTSQPKTLVGIIGAFFKSNIENDRRAQRAAENYKPAPAAAIPPALPPVADEVAIEVKASRIAEEDGGLQLYFAGNAAAVEAYLAAKGLDTSIYAFETSENGQETEVYAKDNSFAAENLQSHMKLVLIAHDDIELESTRERLLAEHGKIEQVYTNAEPKSVSEEPAAEAAQPVKEDTLAEPAPEAVEAIEPAIEATATEEAEPTQGKVVAESITVVGGKVMINFSGGTKEEVQQFMLDNHFNTTDYGFTDSFNEGKETISVFPVLSELENGVVVNKYKSFIRFVANELPAEKISADVPTKYLTAPVHPIGIKAVQPEKSSWRAKLANFFAPEKPVSKSKPASEEKPANTVFANPLIAYSITESRKGHPLVNFTNGTVEDLEKYIFDNGFSLVNFELRARQSGPERVQVVSATPRYPDSEFAEAHAEYRGFYALVAAKLPAESIKLSDATLAKYAPVKEAETEKPVAAKDTNFLQRAIAKIKAGEPLLDTSNWKGLQKPNAPVKPAAAWFEKFSKVLEGFVSTPLLDSKQQKRLGRGVVAAAALTGVSIVGLRAVGDKLFPTETKAPTTSSEVQNVDLRPGYLSQENIGNLQNGEIEIHRAAGATIVKGLGETKYAIKKGDIVRFKANEAQENISSGEYGSDFKKLFNVDKEAAKLMLKEPAANHQFTLEQSQELVKLYKDLVKQNAEEKSKEK